MTRPSRLRFYRVLLGFLPARFRRERSAEMERLFLDMREHHAVGGWSRFRFWLGLVWDVSTQAVHERLRPSRGPRRNENDRSWREVVATFVSDMRYALRNLISRPSYGVLVVLMMTLGIAGNAAVFRIFNGLFLRPLPFADSHQLVDLDETAPQWDLEYVGIAPPDFFEWRSQNRSFSSMAIYDGGTVNFAGVGEPERIEHLVSTHDLLEVLQIEPVLGRFYSEEEDRPDGPDVVLLSHGFWQGQFGGDPDVLGRSVLLNSEPHEIIGVLPPEAEFVGDAQVWGPMQEDPDQWSGWWASGVGRLEPGVTLEAARADLLRIHRAMADERSANEITSPVLDFVRDRYLGEYRLGSGVLLASVGIVLLIACANIAGLTLARGLARSREIAVRVALGASRTRIVRQLLTESLLLAAVGAAFGTGLGVWGSSALVARMSDQFPAWVTFDLDLRFVAFTVAVTVAAAVLFGLAPALQASRTDTRGVLQASTARTTATIGRRRSLNVLVAGEIALALLLLVVAGLNLRDLLQLQRMDPGYRSESLLTFRVGLPSIKYDDGEKRLAFFDEYLERIRALPGVTAAAAANVLPLSGHWGWFYEVDGAPPKGPDDPNPVVLNRVVTPGYLETMGVTLVAGRGFTERDGRDLGSRAVLVNESFVDFFFPNDPNPIGKRVGPGGDDDWMTIIGITRDVKHYGVDEEMRPGVYQPLQQLPRAGLHIAIRTSGDPLSLVSSARRVLAELDPELAIYNAQPMSQRLGDSLWARQAQSWLIAAFSTVALVLAVAGIYGVISYSVGQRVHEISVRMALGAQSSQVMVQVMKQGMLLVAVGAALGLAGAYAIANVLASLLVGVSPTDLAVYGVVTGLLVGVAAVANFFPARRAARLEPMEALRTE